MEKSKKKKKKSIRGGVLVHAGTSSTEDMEARGLGVQGQPQIYSEFEARLSQNKHPKYKMKTLNTQCMP